jgi:hypothetical protein
VIRTGRLHRSSTQKHARFAARVRFAADATLNATIHLVAPNGLPQVLRQQASAGTGKAAVQPAKKAAEAALRATAIPGVRKRPLSVTTPAAAAANATSSAAAAAKRLTTAAAHHQRSVAPHSTPTAAAASTSTSAASAGALAAAKAPAKGSASTGATSAKPHATVAGTASKATGATQLLVPASSAGGQNIAKGAVRCVYTAPHLYVTCVCERQAGMRWWKPVRLTVGMHRVRN